MAKILLGIALAVMIATGVLGYFAKTQADKLQSVLHDTKQDLATTRTNLAKTKDELATRTKELADANAKIEEKDKEIAVQKGQIDELNNKLTAASADLEAKTKEIADLNKKLTDAMQGPTGEKVDPAQLAAQIKELRDNLFKAQTEAAESRALVDAITKQKKEVETKVVVLEQYKTRVEKQLMTKGLSGRILAVNTGWNFVVLSIGDKQGAAMNATMLVTRSGEPIAKVRITSVEPSTSIADILPGSVRKGTTVQPGDNVIFEGRNPTSAAVVSPPAGAADVAPALPQR